VVATENDAGDADVVDSRRQRLRTLLRWAPVLALTLASTAAVVKVGADHVLPVQVVAAAVGAAMTVGGAAVVAHGWPRRSASEWRSLTVSAGFFGACLGVSVMLLGVGLFH
jgi:hypothetical protein